MGGEEPRDPVDFNGFSVEKDLPTGGSFDQNCEMWAIVDFGHGPTEVRCTRSGKHDQHGCVIQFVDDEEESDPSMN